MSKLPAPEGSVTGFNEFMRLPVGTKLYHVSRQYSREGGWETLPCVHLFDVRYVTDENGIDVQIDENRADGVYTYLWAKFKKPRCWIWEKDSYTTDKVSLIDCNVIRNSYNDWFLFRDLESAVAYLSCNGTKTVMVKMDIS